MTRLEKLEKELLDKKTEVEMLKAEILTEQTRNHEHYWNVTISEKDNWICGLCECGKQLDKEVVKTVLEYDFVPF